MDPVLCFVSLCLAPVNREGRLVRSMAASQPGGVGPGGEGVQVKHGPAPAVDGQCNAKDANDVHDYACPGLMEERMQGF